MNSIINHTNKNKEKKYEAKINHNETNQENKKQYSVRTQTENRNTKEMKDMCMKHTTRSGNTLIRCSHVNNNKWDKAYLLILKPEDCKAGYINYCPNCGGKLKEY